MATADDGSLMPVSGSADQVDPGAGRELDVGPVSAEVHQARAAAAGDEAAITALYTAHAQALANRLRHLCGDAAWAQDLVHDTFIVALARGASFAGRGSVEAWLHGVAFNLWRSGRRKAKRRGELLVRSPPAHNSLPQADTGSEQRALLVQLDVALAELKPKLREAFVLRCIERRPLSDAARLAGCRVSTMSARARKAEALVRVAFDRQAADPLQRKVNT